MKKFTYLKGFLLLILVITASSNVFSQSVAPSPASFINTAGQAVTLTGSQTNASRHFTVASWAYLSGPQVIPVGATTFSPNATSNGNTVSATATFPLGAAAGTYTFRLSYTITTNTAGTTTTTGTLDATVTVTAPSLPFGCNGQFYISHSDAGQNNFTGNTALDSLSFAGGNFTANNFTVTGGMGFNGIGLNPVDGFMYAARYSSGAPNTRVHLVKIGRTSTNETDLGEITVGAGFITTDALAGCFDIDGTYYINAGSNLYKLSAIPGVAATLVGATTSMADIAINPVDGLMYGSSGGGTLYSINKATGAATSIGNFAGSGLMAGLFFTEDGSLYGYRGDGTFWLINKANAALTAAGTATAYSNADGCSCSFRVGHIISPKGFCPTPVANPIDSLQISTSNSSGLLQTGLTYALSISDPKHRFRFTETAAQIAQKLFDKGFLLTNSAANVTLGVTGGAISPNWDTITVLNFRVPTGPDTFRLKVQLYTLGGPYPNVNIQSKISGLPAGLGGTDLSGNGISPHAPTGITFCANAGLPVKLISFSGSYKSNATLLSWETSNETNFAYYEIQRSSNGIEFGSLGTKDAQVGFGTLKYQYKDDLTAVSGGTFFYRLKMVDLDGSFKYSNVIMIRRDEKAVIGLILSPNPLTANNSLTVRYNAPSNGTVMINLIDMSGKRILQQQSQVTEGNNSISIVNLSHLQSGIYTLQVVNETSILNTKLSVIR